MQTRLGALQYLVVASLTLLAAQFWYLQVLRGRHFRELAENNRRNWGLRFEQLMQALQVIVQAPHWSTLTICELNPDHGESDGSTLRTFIEALANILSTAPALVGSKGH